MPATRRSWSTQANASLATPVSASQKTVCGETGNRGRCDFGGTIGIATQATVPETSSVAEPEAHL